jgi:diguanylate cyclase (GGDEF)-like protein
LTNVNLYLSGILFISTLITLLIALYSSRQKDIPASIPFTCLCAASTLYSFGYGMELLNHDLNITLLWNLFQYLGIESIPVFWFLVAIFYCGKENLVKGWKKAPIILIPISFFLIRFTNSYHHLFFKDAFMVSNGYFQIMHLVKGPLYILSAAINISAVFYSNYLYLKLLIQSKGKFQIQSAIMFIASITPLAGYFMLVINISPLDIDYTPFFSTLSYILVLVGLFKYNFLNLVPLAHHKVFESIKEAVIVLDSHYNLLDFNAAASGVFGELNRRSIGSNIERILGEHDHFLRSVYDGKEMQYEKTDASGSMFYSVNLTVLNGKFKKVIGYIVTMNDITKQIETMNKLQKMAEIDPLTEMFNRRYFLETFEQELINAKVRKQPISLIMFDLDRFKKINDRYGHQAGDVLLRNVSNICRSSVRSNDTLGRYGGEEFLILLPNTTLQEAVEVGERIRKNIENLNVIFNSRHLKITASLGIAGILRTQDENVDQFIKFADNALYEAKKSGRNCIKTAKVFQVI